MLPASRKNSNALWRHVNLLDRTPVDSILHPGDSNIKGAWKRTNCGIQCQNLYFTIDDKIELGDWCIDSSLSQPAKLSIGEPMEGKKIIATSDLRLDYPRPSKEFIEKYCSEGGIDEIFIEYEEIYINDKTGEEIGDLIFDIVDSIDNGSVIPRKKKKILVNENNEIIISKEDIKTEINPKWLNQQKEIVNICIVNALRIDEEHRFMIIGKLVQNLSLENKNKLLKILNVK